MPSCRYERWIDVIVCAWIRVSRAGVYAGGGSVDTATVTLESWWGISIMSCWCGGKRSCSAMASPCGYRSTRALVGRGLERWLDAVRYQSVHERFMVVVVHR
jgi:hypothetical protein